MDASAFSRRQFFQKAFCLPLIPVALGGRVGNARTVPDCFSATEELADQKRISEALKKNEPLIWLFTGDSITHGAKHTHGFRAYPEIFSERVRWELRRMRDIVINTGISGNTTENILDDFKWRVKQFSPHVVSLMIGTNDCANGRIPVETFGNNLSMLIKQFRKLAAIPVIHTPNIIITEKDSSRSRLPEYVAVIRRIASAEKVILVDNHRYWQDAFHGKTGVKVYRDWLNDPLHPDGDGHSEIARLMFRKLGIFDPQAPTCGAAYYEGFHEQ